LASKISKSAVLYVHARPGATPECSYTCGECIFLRTNQCALFTVEDNLVSATRGGCGLFVDGAPQDDGFWPYLTKEEAGYVENENGFGCRRCKEFVPSLMDCEDVNKTSPGDDPNSIQGGACCNNWQADARRGRMDDDRLALELRKDLEKADRIAALRGDART
jgi:hypothetical protein